MSTDLLLAQRYRLIARLGAGGMGSVWLAHDLTLNAEVAVKLINPEHLGSPEAMARFRREAQAAAAIRSTHVIQILDYGFDGETPYIVMERLIGESLSSRLSRVGVLSPRETASILSQVAQALSLAHQHGIVHRDVKPENIFVIKEDDGYICKILDFGIAHQPEACTDFECLRTQTGAILGTPCYMSPEQAAGQVVDHLSDIWAFGVIAVECLTGKRPFTSQSLHALFQAINVAPLPVPSRLGVVPAGFDDWFARATSRDRSQRFPSIQMAADELRAICGNTNDIIVDAPRVVPLQGGPSDAVASQPGSFARITGGVWPRRLGPRSSATRLAVLVALPLLTGIVAAAYWLRNRGETIPTSAVPRVELARSAPAIGKPRETAGDSVARGLSNIPTPPAIAVPKTIAPGRSADAEPDKKSPNVSRQKSAFPRRAFGDNAAGI